MSIVIRFGRSRIFARAAAPMTPPAGPERIRLTGCSRAELAVIAPPPERVMRKRPPNPPEASSPSSVCR